MPAFDITIEGEIRAYREFRIVADTAEEARDLAFIEAERIKNDVEEWELTPVSPEFSSFR